MPHSEPLLVTKEGRRKSGISTWIANSVHREPPDGCRLPDDPATEDEGVSCGTFDEHG
jgi:hypothetical protein